MLRRTPLLALTILLLTTFSMAGSPPRHLIPLKASTAAITGRPLPVDVHNRLEKLNPYITASAAFQAERAPQLLEDLDPLKKPAPLSTESISFKQDTRPASEKIVPPLQQKVAQMPTGAKVRVVVLLTEPTLPAGSTHSLSARMVPVSDRIATLEHRFVDEAARSGFRPLRGMRNFPIVAGTIPRSRLDELASLPTVRSIEEDTQLQAERVEGGHLIKSDQLRQLGGDGAGIGIAIIDSGIDWNHPELPFGTKVVARGDFTGTQTGEDKGMDDFGHGTACAGIATGLQGGMVPAATVWALKVLDAEGKGQDSTTMAALDSVYDHRNDFGGVRVVSMSLGAPLAHSYGYCDLGWPAYAQEVSKLVDAGITVFAASGNEGCAAGISHPACFQDTISVGAVYDANVGARGNPAPSICNLLGCMDPTTAADQITCYSNSGAALDILAPADCATTTKMGGGYEDCFNGTSAATPYAAGVAAQILSLRPSTTPQELRAALLSTGQPITDWRNLITRNRIDAVAAYDALTGSAGQAAQYESWLPVVVHVSGAKESKWRSDVSLFNLGTGPATVSLTVYLPSGSVDAQLTSTLPSLSQVVLADILGQLGLSGAGPLKIVSDQPVTITSRTYSQESTGTFGQFLAPSYASHTLSAGEQGWIQHLVENTSFRTNIGVANFGPTSAQGTVSFFDQYGQLLGSVPFALGPGGYTQANQPFSKTFGHSVSGGTAVVSLTSGSGVTAYASVIDNGSNDPTTIPMMEDEYGTELWVPVVIHLSGAKQSQWRSDVSVLNLGSSSANVSVTAFLASGTQQKHLAAPLAPGQQVILPDVVGQLGVESYGPLKIESDQPIAVTSRSYSQGAKGSFGQFLAAEAPDDGLKTGSAGLLQGLIENAAFRTNIGIANFGTDVAKGSVYLVAADGSLIGELPFSVQPSGYMQFNQPFQKNFGVTIAGGAAVVSVTSGSGVTAYASVIDNGSNDPTTIPLLH